MLFLEPSARPVSAESPGQEERPGAELGSSSVA